MTAARHLIGTFHKTGTALWTSILREGRRSGVIAYCDMNADPHDAEARIFFNHHADWIGGALAEADAPVTPDDRWLVTIRDPRDVIVSAAHYHAIARESWCLEPRKEFGGLTYQEKINSYPNLHDRFLFEMEGSAGRTIRAMVEMRGKLPPERALFVRLEDLLTDWHLSAFRTCFAFLDLPPGRLVDMLGIAVECSLFATARETGRGSHARSGKVAEFRNAFSDRVHARFRDAFPDSLAALGYPEDGHHGGGAYPRATPPTGEPSWPARTPRAARGDTQ